MKTKFAFMLLVVLAASLFKFGLGNSSALVISGGGVSTGFNNSSSHPGTGVSNCAGEPPGDTANVRCQTESLDPDSYLQIWEPVGGGAVTMQVSYTCATGFESFNITKTQGGTLSFSGDNNPQYNKICDGTAVSQGIGTGGNKALGGTITITPGSGNCTYYNNNFCQMVLDVSAVNPPTCPVSGDPNSSYCFYGGNVIVNLNIISNNCSGGNCADIEAANSYYPTNDPSSGLTPNKVTSTKGDGFSVNVYSWPTWSYPAQQYSDSNNQIIRKFQDDCTATNGKAWVAWENADAGLDSAGGSMSMEIVDITPGSSDNGNIVLGPVQGSALGSTSTSENTAAGPANTIYSNYFNAKAGHRYKWVWSNVGSNDPIALSVPYEENSIDYNSQCWKLSGQTLVSTDNQNWSQNSTVTSKGSSGSKVYFKDIVTNSSTDSAYNANYTWTVKTNYSPGTSGYDNSHTGYNAWGGTSSEPACNPPATGVTNEAPGGSAPNGSPPPAHGYCVYQFPSSAPSGAQFCMYVQYTNANGPNTDAGDNSGSKACVTYSSATDWTLTGTTKVNGTTLLPGESATFNSRVLNNGPNTASYWWWVQGCYYTKAQGSSHCSAGSGNYNDSNCTTNNAVASPCNLSTEGTSSSYITCPADNYCPAYDTGKAAEKYSFPSSASPGDGYCERIGYGNATGLSTGNDYSTIKCVTYDTAPPGGIVSDCTEAEINTGSGYTVGFPNTTTTPSPDSVTPAGISYAIYVANSSPSSSPPGTTLSSGDFLPGEPGTSADDVANANPYSTYQNIGTNPAPPTTFPTLPGAIIASANDVAFNKNITVPLPAADLMAGTVTWYLVLFNHVGVEDVPTSAGNYAAYYSNTDYIQIVSNYTTSNCFTTLSCNVVVSGTLGGQNTEAGKQFGYDVPYSYSGSAANSIDTVDGIAPTITATYTGDSGGAGLPPAPPSANVGPIDPGGSGTTFYNYPTAPNDTDSWNINIQIGYPGTPLKDLASCSSPVNDYQHFNYSANALAVPIKSQADQQQTNEDPGAIKKTYTYNESGSSTVPNNLGVTGGLYYIAAGGAPPSYSPVSCGQPTQVECDSNLQQSSSPVVHYYNIPSTPNAGDSYCILVSLSPSTGYVGPGGNYINPSNWPNSITEPSPSSGGCTTIHNEPYVSFTGNDVIGNTDFNDICQQPNLSGIYTFSTNSSSSYTPPYSTTQGTGGSASQFGAQAVSIIEGLGSASFRNGANIYSPKGSNALGLSFANGNDNTNNVSPSPPTDGNPMGGEFGYSQNDSSCEPDYYNDDKPLMNNMISVSTGNIDSELNTNNTPAVASATNPYNGYNYYSGSSLTIGNGGSSIDINNGVKATIFVNGNVYITSNIAYRGANGGGSGWSTIADIPSFYIIAKGNIFISPNVTQLDGAYIAQPTSETSKNTGIIDTCSNGFSAYSPSDLYGNQTGCNQQLTVNGAFVDQATLLDRSFSSLRYSEAGENTISNFSGHNSGTSCGHPGQDIHNSFGSNPPEDCAAEVFNFSPELYLAQPSFQPASGPTIGKYNFVTSLSPTL